MKGERHTYCAGTYLGHAQAGLAVDGRVYLAQEKLLSRQVAQPVPRCVGAAFAIQPRAQVQDEPRRGDGSRWRLVRKPHAFTLSKTDRARDESKVGSGFGKKVANWLERDKVYPNNVLHRATECGNRQHSAAFPYWLPEWFIDLFTDAGDVVLDPFVGSGTTAFAALDKGRSVIGVEIHKPYCDTLKGQLEEKYGQALKLVVDGPQQTLRSSTVPI